MSVLDRCMVCIKRTIRSKIVLVHPWYSKAMTLKWKLVSVRLEIVLILMQDRCTIYTELTIGSAIILDTLDGIPR
jgi:hypothetical protein